MNIQSVITKILFIILLVNLWAPTSIAQKTLALTIDDLPFVGEARNFHLAMMMDTLIKEQVPATGFIIASEVHAENWKLLHQFKEAGFGLGNHTFSHANLNTTETKKYIHEIKAADAILEPVLTEPKYFRYPYLAMSSGIKKDKITGYLAKHHYHIAPITIDSKDFAFNQRLMSVPEAGRRAYLEELKPFYLDFIWKQTLKAEEHSAYHHNPDQIQILLIHANLLNAYVLPDIIKQYKEKGYHFSSLEQALNTPQNSLPNSKPQPAFAKASDPVSDATIEAFVDWD